MPIRISLLTLAVLLASLVAAAQGAGRTPALSAAEIEQARAACDQLATMPNAPMSVESCKAMLNTAERLEAAMSDPSARRPGDEAMSCAAIFAEMKTLAGVGISEATSARAAAAGARSKALQQKQTAEFGAFMAQTYGLGVVAGAVGAVTPNFVGAAIAAAWQAQAMSFAARQAAEQAPVRAEMNESVTAALGELSESMQANPRFGRLVQLAADKGCEPPPDAAR
jgi:hypothetical protein